MKPKHTPGPWNIDNEVSEDGPVIYSKKGYCFVQVTGKKKRADAHLIAAAPELLSDLEYACKMISSLIGPMYVEEAGPWVKALNGLRQTIAKARGEV